MNIASNLKQTCGACPSQWEGELVGGGSFYIRYRWGYLSLSFNGKEVMLKQLGDGLDGVLSTNDMAIAVYPYLAFVE